MQCFGVVVPVVFGSKRTTFTRTQGRTMGQSKHSGTLNTAANIKEKKKRSLKRNVDNVEKKQQNGATVTRAKQQSIFDPFH